MDLTTYKASEPGALARLAKAAALDPVYLSHLIAGRKAMTIRMAERLIAASGGALDFDSLMRESRAAVETLRSRKPAHDQQTATA